MRFNIYQAYTVLPDEDRKRMLDWCQTYELDEQTMRCWLLAEFILEHEDHDRLSKDLCLKRAGCNQIQPFSPGMVVSMEKEGGLPPNAGSLQVFWRHALARLERRGLLHRGGGDVVFPEDTPLLMQETGQPLGVTLCVQETDPVDDELVEEKEEEEEEVVPVPPAAVQEEAEEEMPTQHVAAKDYFASQKEVGNDLLKAILRSLNGRPFDSLAEVLILVPSINTLHSQTLSRVNASDLKVKCTVVKCNDRSAGDVDDFWTRAERTPKQLFVVVHDEAHFAIGKYKEGEHAAAVADQFLNRAHKPNSPWQLPNVVRVLVTATPYALQTKYTRIPQGNEVYWTATPGPDDAVKYCGLAELRATLNNGNPEQHRAVFDKEFEHLCGKGKDTSTRFKALVQAYQTALEAVAKAGTGSTETTTAPETTTAQTERVVRDLLGNIDTEGKGSMVLVRVVNNTQGKSAADALRETRRKLGLDDCFSILYDISTLTLCKVLQGDPASGALAKLRKWNKDPKFVPASYEHLDHLPCILLLCDKGRMGDTFPKSFKFYDLRLRYSTVSSRAFFEQDLGRMFRYAADASKLPTALLPPSALAPLSDINKFYRLVRCSR